MPSCLTPVAALPKDCWRGSAAISTSRPHSHPHCNWLALSGDWSKLRLVIRQYPIRFWSWFGFNGFA